MKGEFVSSALVIIFIFLYLLLIIGVAVFVFNKLKLKDKTARQIEIAGYYLLFVVLVWELLFKNILSGDFYDADSYYLSEKINVLFQMLESIINDTTPKTWELSKYFYGLSTTEHLNVQLLTIDIIESILKILSTVFIAVGRFQELKKMKTKDEANEITKIYAEQNESNNISIDTNMSIVRKLKVSELPILAQLFNYKDIDDMISENTRNIENGIVDIFAMFYDDQLIGELHVKYDNEDKDFAEKGKRAYLFAFRVHKDYQGKGWGSYLLETVINELNANGYHELTVGVEDDNIRARYMYEKYGFVQPIARIKETYQGDSYEYDLLMRKDY